MKKIFIVSALMFSLASCMGQKETAADFNSLYKANIAAEVKEQYDFSKAFMWKAQEAAGRIDGAFSLTGYTTVDAKFAANYNTLAIPQEGVEMSLSQPMMEVSTKDDTGPKSVKFSADTVQLVSDSFQSFAKYENPKVEMTATEEEQASLKKLQETLSNTAGKWVSLVNEQVYTEAQKQFIRKLATAKEEDVVKVLQNYVLFTASGAAVKNDSKYTFDVTLNNDAIIQAMKDFAKNLDLPMSEDNVTKMSEELKKLNVTGKVTYDSKNALYSEFVLNFSMKDSPVVFEWNGKRDESAELTYDMAVVQKDSYIGGLQWKSKFKGINGNLTLKAFQYNGTKDNALEIATLTAEVKDDILQNLSLIAKYDILKVNAHAQYKNKEGFTADVVLDGVKMLDIKHAPAGDISSGYIKLQDQDVATWTVKTIQDTLKGFTMEIKNIGNPAVTKPLIALNLTEQTDSEYIKGKTVINISDTESLSADVGLLISGNKTEWKFGITLDNIVLPSVDPWGTYLQSLKIYTDGKVSETSKTLTLPTEFISAEEFQKQFDAISSYEIPEDTSKDAEPVVAAE